MKLIFIFPLVRLLKVIKKGPLAAFLV